VHGLCTISILAYGWEKIRFNGEKVRFTDKSDLGCVKIDWLTTAWIVEKGPFEKAWQILCRAKQPP